MKAQSCETKYRLMIKTAVVLYTNIVNKEQLIQFFSHLRRPTLPNAAVRSYSKNIGSVSKPENKIKRIV